MNKKNNIIINEIENIKKNDNIFYSNHINKSHIEIWKKIIKNNFFLNDKEWIIFKSRFTDLDIFKDNNIDKNLIELILEFNSEDLNNLNKSITNSKILNNIESEINKLKNLQNIIEKKLLILDPTFSNELIEYIYKELYKIITISGHKNSNNLWVISINLIISHLYNQIYKKLYDEKITINILKNILESLLEWRHYDIKKLYEPELNIKNNSEDDDDNEKQYPTWNIYLPIEYEFLKTFLFITKTDYPMIINPVPWKYNNYEKNLVNGGYYKNSKESIKEINNKFYEKLFNEIYCIVPKKIIDIQPNKLLNKVSIIINKNCNFVDQINTIQNTKIYYNFDNFLYFFNIIPFIKIKNNISNEKLYFINILEKINNNIEKEEEQLKNQIKLDKYKQEIFFSEFTLDDSNMLKLCYTLNFIYNFYSNKSINNLKNNIYFYYVLNLDFRGRHYYESLYSHMQNPLLRNFIILNPEKTNTYNLYNIFYILWQEKKIYNINNINIEEKINTFKNKYIDFIEKKDNSNIFSYRNPIIWYNTVKCIIEKKTYTISLDACASMIQFLSILLDNKELATLVNIQSDNIEDNINDPYIYIKNKIIEENDKIIKEINFYKENNIIYDNKKTKLLFDPIYYDIITDRKIIKYVIMTTIYGSTPYSISDNLKKKKNLKYFNKKKLIHIFNSIIKIFNTHFPGLLSLKSTLRYINLYLVKNNKSISYTFNDEYPTFQYNYVSNKGITITSSNEYKELNIKIKCKDTNTLDEKKTLAGSLANFIHFLDARVLHQTLYNLKKKNIDCLGIHDCFIINSIYYEECLNEYNKNLAENLNLNILKCFNIDINDFKFFLDTYTYTVNLKTGPREYKISDKKKNEIFNIINLKKKNISKEKLLNSKFSLLPT